jgi:hypothetical protein
LPTSILTQQYVWRRKERKGKKRRGSVVIVIKLLSIYTLYLKKEEGERE